jgi:hypothetical protein
LATLTHTKAARETRNTYGLPTGESIRRELRVWFRRQRKEMLDALRKGTTGKDQFYPDLPPFDFEAWAKLMAEPFTPILEAYWEESGQRFLSRNGLDEGQWQVVNPNTQRKIEQAAFDFCEETNRTTSESLGRALQGLRSEMIQGIVTEGATVAELTKAVNAVFDQAETWRARRIAMSEASRAVHAAQEDAAIQTGIVVGWEWLLSSDACSLCQTVARRVPAVRIGQPFAVVGDHPTYSEVRFPPLHPHCMCAVTEILAPEYGGPNSVQFAPTLEQPVPEEEDLIAADELEIATP